MQEGGLDIQFLVVGDGDAADSLSVIEKVYAEVESHPDVLTVVKNVAEIKKAKSEGKVGFLMTLEDAKWLSGDLDILRLYYRLGIRSVALTHGQDGDEPHHIQGDRSFFGYREMRDGEDDQVKALAAIGGMMGIAFVPGFVDQSNPTLERLLDHIEYVANLVGIDHVGIGSDYDGMSDVPAIPEVSQLPWLTEGMVKRGMSDEEVAKVLGGNFLRVLEATIG